MKATAEVRHRRSARVAATVAVIFCGASLAGTASAAVSRVEAESLAHTGSCWSVLASSMLSGGAGRTCYAEAAPLTWTVVSRDGDVVQLRGYRDAVARGFRVRIDGGPWRSGTLQGTDSYSANFFTSPTLTAGSHTFELEWVNSSGAITMDYYEVLDGAGSTTTTAPPTTTTTTAPPTTTTTTAPPTTTTTTTPPSGKTVRVEAESLPHSGACWAVLSYGRFSGGAGRWCYASRSTLTATVTVATDDVLRLYGYRDAVTRGFRVRIDAGAWVQGALVGAETASALFFTSPALTAGTHTVELEWVDSPGAITVDFYEVTGRGAASPGETTTTTRPSTSTTTSTTTVPTSTTTSTTSPPTTTAPPTTTTVPPNTGGGTCKIAPADGQAAITAAIAGCPDGSTVQFPTGVVYRQSDPIDVINRSNLVIDGGGSTFVNTAPNTEVVQPNWRLKGAHGVTFRNMTVAGNFKMTGPRSLPAVQAIAFNQRNSGFFIFGGRNVTIADVKVRDVFGDGVTVVPSNWAPDGVHPLQLASSEFTTNLRIVRLDVTRTARQCVGVTAARGFWLEDSTLRDCWYGGVDFERDGPGYPQTDLHVLRNTFDGFNIFAVAATWPGNDGDTNGLEIRGNRTLTPGDTCHATIIIGYNPDNPNRFFNIVVADNQLKALYHVVTFDHVQGGSVTNNRLEKTAPDSLCGPPAGVPVRMTNSAGITVSGNTLVGFG